MSDGFLRRATSRFIPAAIPAAWWLFGLLGATVVLLSLGGESWRETLRYERLAVLRRGEYWRLLTGHLVHGTTLHLILNGAGLALVAALFPREYGARAWLLILVLSMVAIDLGFVLCEPQLDWYVGLSGVLHGVLAAGVIAWWRHESKALALVLTLLLTGKLIWEQWQGALPLSGDMPVVVDAHLYGALGGTVAGAIVWLLARHWPARSRSL